jgi:hypothetical protein
MLCFSDEITLRIQAFSFFIFIIICAAAALWGIWKSMRRDFPGLPELSFKDILIAVLLWGLAFHLALVLISGTRDVMAPAATIHADPGGKKV